MLIYLSCYTSFFNSKKQHPFSNLTPYYSIRSQSKEQYKMLPALSGNLELDSRILK